MMDDLNSVQTLLAGFAQAHGVDLPGEIDPGGAEIEIEGRKLRILPTEIDSVAIIEVDVCELSEAQRDSADLLLNLHQLNHEARFTHGWMAAIDDLDILVVSAPLQLALVQPEDLPDLIEDGLDRAESLAGVVAGLSSPTLAVEAQTQGADSSAFIRG